MTPRPIEPNEVIAEGGRDAAGAELETPQLPNARVHRADSLADVVIPENRVYLTAREAAAYVRCASVKSFYQWCYVRIRAGRLTRRKPLRFTRAELDRVLQPPQQGRRYFKSHMRGTA